MFEINLNHLLSAYRFLKTYTYHENINLFLKTRLANFEETYISAPINSIRKDYESSDITEDRENITVYDIFNIFLESDSSTENPFNQLIHVLNSEAPWDNEFFIGWLNDISFNLLPKNVEIGDAKESDSTRPLFLTNKKTDNKYRVTKVNYFVDAPIEIHILETMWTLLVGSRLDEKLTTECYGNRISDFVSGYRRDFYDSEETDLTKRQGEIFKRYIEQYNQWRDQAIASANVANT